MPAATFLGTGNYLAPGRYWNSFVLDGTVLVEPSPSALPNLRRCGIDAAAIDTVFVSHFHADHTFGWPFLALEFLRRRRGQTLWVVGPRGIEEFLDEMMVAGAVPEVGAAMKHQVNVEFVEVDGSWQQVGVRRFRAIEVEHVPTLDCYGYVFDYDGRMIGYSGDTRRCAGLDELVGACEAVVLECNGEHPPPPTHLDERAVADLRQRFPSPRFVLTHLGESVDASAIANTYVPSDFETVEL
jgi:ribonuclease Z